MTRKLKPLFSKFDACTQTNLVSSAYDGQAGDPVHFHQVAPPAVRKVGDRGRDKKAQSGGAAGYKRSGGYAKFNLPKSQKLRPSQVDRLLDRFGKFLEKKEKKSVTQARKKEDPQEVVQSPSQKVGLVVDERTLYVDVVEVVDFQPSPSEQTLSQPLNNGQFGSQTYVRGPGGFLPTSSGQWQPSASGSCGYQVDESSTLGFGGSQVGSGLPSTSGSCGFQVDSGLPSTSGSQVDSGLPSTSGSQVDETSTFGFVPPSVEAVSSVFGVELTPEEETTVVSVGELAAALPYTQNPTLASSAPPGSPEPVPNSWPSGQPDFQTLSDLELIDPFLEPWDLWSFERDIARLNSAHPWVLSGAVDDVLVSDPQSKLPWEVDSGEDQGVGWSQHLGQDHWDILPFLCNDDSG